VCTASRSTSTTRWKTAAKGLTKLRALSVSAEADCGAMAMPLECRWLAVLGAACPRLRSVRVAVCNDAIELVDMNPFLDAVSCTLDELVLIRYHCLLDDSWQHLMACNAVCDARGGTGYITDSSRAYMHNSPRRNGTARELRTMHTVMYTRQSDVRAHVEWASQFAK
jgi:hypothetical protein